MIDTIILRVHNTRRNKSLIRSLELQSKNNGYSTEFAKIDSKDVKMLRRQGFNDTKEILSILKMQRTGEFLIKSKVSKQVNASNHYTFAYFINYTKDYIEFNFSIPKYIYGSNVLMFVDHITDKGFVLSDGSTMEYNIERAFEKLRGFLIQLFRVEFLNVNVDPADVEVHRIDVCFNQVFRTKPEALKYLEYQKRQRKKYSRNEEGVIRDYATSLMYTTKRYSAKIYHKGSEYEKNDLKEHEKINKEKGRQYFKTNEYKDFADRILRYELTIRNGMLNYLHKKFIFRRKCPDWQIYFQQYQKVEAAIQRNQRIAEKVGTLADAEKESYLQEHPYERIPKEARSIYKAVSKVINKRTYFVLKTDEEIDKYNATTVNYDCNKALFSKGLLKACFKQLIGFINEYQIKELPQEEMIAKLIDDYNSKHKSRLPKSEMVGFYKELMRIGSFKDVAKMNYMSRTTMYRYKERFKKIGITDNNLIPLTEDGIPRAETDLRQYHTEHIYNAHFLTKNNFLDIF